MSRSCPVETNMGNCYFSPNRKALLNDLRRFLDFQWKGNQYTLVAEILGGRVLYYRIHILV